MFLWAGFTSFEQVVVGATNPGYVKIGQEIISYEGVSGDNLTGITRGIDDTKVEIHQKSDKVTKYELNGVSLRRINKTHSLNTTSDITRPITLDSYYIKIDMSSNGVNRSEGQSHSLLSTLQRLRRVVELTEDRLITFPSIALFLRLIQLFPKEQQSLHLSERLLEHLLMELNHRSLIRDSLDQLSTQRPGLMIQERFTQWRTRTLSSLHFPITNRSPSNITGDRISPFSPN